jgi:hypothetical protein
VIWSYGHVSENVCLNVPLCSLVHTNPCFRGAYCLHHQGIDQYLWDDEVISIAVETWNLTLMNLGVPQSARNNLISWETISFSIRTVLYRVTGYQVGHSVDIVALGYPAGLLTVSSVNNVFMLAIQLRRKSVSHWVSQSLNAIYPPCQLISFVVIPFSQLCYLVTLSDN